MNFIKKIPQNVLIITLVILGLFVLQSAINCIPQKAIKENIVKSLEEVEESGTSKNRIHLIPSYYAATDDRPGDFAWLQVIYNVDSEHPIKSTIAMNRYTNYEKFHEELREQIDNDLPANDSYSRYWHGTTMIMRILLLFLSLTEMKFFLGGIITILWFFAFLRCKDFSFWLIPAFVLGGGVFCVLSVEYMSVFIITPIVLILLTKIKDFSIPVIFLLSGTLTAYFDFLTAETLTLTIPLLFLFYKGKDSKLCITAALHWGLGYTTTMGIRVIISLFVKNQSFSTILKDKFVTDKKRTQHYDGLNSVVKNFRELIPVENVRSMHLAVILVLIVITIAFALIVFWRKDWDLKRVLILASIGVIPIVRLSLLNGHAYFHSEFTCRALIATILSLLLMFKETFYKITKNKKKGFLKR